MQKVAFIVNPTRHLSSKLELYFRHQRRITMQSFGMTLKHSKHHACSFHSTAWVPPPPPTSARLSWLLWVPPWWREHDSCFPGAPAGRNDTSTSIHHDRMNLTKCCVSEQHRGKGHSCMQAWRRGHRESSSEETVLELHLEEGVRFYSWDKRRASRHNNKNTYPFFSHKNDVSHRPVLWLWNQSQYLEEPSPLNSRDSGTWSSLQICVQMPVSGWTSLSCLF